MENKIKRMIGVARLRLQGGGDVEVQGAVEVGEESLWFNLMCLLVELFLGSAIY